MAVTCAVAPRGAGTRDSKGRRQNGPEREQNNCYVTRQGRTRRQATHIAGPLTKGDWPVADVVGGYFGGSDRFAYRSPAAEGNVKERTAVVNR